MEPSFQVPHQTCFCPTTLPESTTNISGDSDHLIWRFQEVNVLSYWHWLHQLYRRTANCAAQLLQDGLISYLSCSKCCSIRPQDRSSYSSAGYAISQCVGQTASAWSVLLIDSRQEILYDRFLVPETAVIYLLCRRAIFTVTPFVFE